MSLISGLIGALKYQHAQRRRARLEVESMWSDAAAQKYFDIVDKLEQADRRYISALADLDSTLEQANRLLGY